MITLPARFERARFVAVLCLGISGCYQKSDTTENSATDERSSDSEHVRGTSSSTDEATESDILAGATDTLDLIDPILCDFTCMSSEDCDALNGTKATQGSCHAPEGWICCKLSEGTDSESGSDTGSGERGTETGITEGDTGVVGTSDWGVCWDYHSTPQTNCAEHCAAAGGVCVEGGCGSFTYQIFDSDQALACASGMGDAFVTGAMPCDMLVPVPDVGQLVRCCCSTK